MASYEKILKKLRTNEKNYVIS